MDKKNFKFITRKNNYAKVLSLTRAKFLLHYLHWEKAIKDWYR